MRNIERFKGEKGVGATNYTMMVNIRNYTALTMTRGLNESNYS